MKRRRKTLIATLALTMLAVLPGVARAGDDTGAPSETAGATDEMTQVLSTLPVLGSGLNVTVTRGERGVIESVALDPDPGATVIKDRDHKMVFLLADGNTQVVVKARKNAVETKVRADSTTDVTGPGEWRGDVFGTGEVVIPYTVAFDGNNPIIEIGAITAPEGVTYEIGEPKSRTDDDGEKSVFKIKVKLSSEDDRAKVSFVAATRVDDDGQVRVSLSVTATEPHRHDRWDGGQRDRDHEKRDHEKRDHDGRSERGDKNGDRGDRGDRDGGRDGNDGDQD